MALILIDTNIFIDMLNGVHQASIELASYDMPAISFVTYMELRCGEFARPHEKAILDAVLDEFHVVEMNKTIMEAAINPGHQPRHETRHQAARRDYRRNCMGALLPGRNPQCKGFPGGRRHRPRSL